MIGARASILGNITVGESCRIGAGSVVLKDVPDNTSVVSRPRIWKRGELPAITMERNFEVNSYCMKLRKQKKLFTLDVNIIMLQLHILSFLARLGRHIN